MGEVRILGEVNIVKIKEVWFEVYCSNKAYDDD